MSSISLAAALLLAVSSVHAQTADLGPDISERAKFLTYPHLQKGLEAMQRGEWPRAFDEFKQALRLSDDNPVVASYLAEAYRRFGDNERARELLRAQLQKHPGHPRLTAAMAALTPKPAPPRSAAKAPSRSPLTPDSPAQPPVAVAAATPSSAPTVTPPPRPAAAVTPARVRSTSAARRPVAPAVKPPPPPPGFAEADAAYKASARGDRARALTLARKASSLAPDNADYRYLLAYQLFENGAYAELVRRVDAMPQADERLKTLASQSRQRLAYAHFEAAQRALGQSEFDRVVTEARKGADLEPRQQAHQLQWVAALLAAERWPEAVAAADRGMRELGGDDSELLVLRAHARQSQGDDGGALADYGKALSLVSSQEKPPINLRLMAADAALVAGEPQRALNFLAPLGSMDDQGVNYRRRLAQSALQRNVLPEPTVPPLLAVPKVICIASPYQAHCDLWPGEQPAPKGQEFAQQAQQAYARAEYTSAADLARKAVALSPDHPRFRLLLVRALLADGQAQAALQLADQYLAKPPREPEMLALRSDIHRRLGQADAAKADADAALSDAKLSVVSEVGLLRQQDPAKARQRFEAAQDSGQLNEMAPTDVGYLAVQVGEDDRALQAFNQAQSAGSLPPHALQDAGYAAGRIGASDAAVGYFKQAIDAQADGRLQLTPQRLFETRREVADRTRSWGAIASLGHRGVSPAAQALGQPTNIGDSTQFGTELYWRPSGYRDGSYYEVYGGGFTTLDAGNGQASGKETTQGMLGVRAKPFRNANLVLAFERRFKIGSRSIDDWLLRVGYSYTYGTDLRVDQSSWTTAQVYAEAGRFFDKHITYGTVEAQLGRSFRLDAVHPHLVLFPHAVFGADHNSKAASGKDNATGAGVGVGVRYWFNEDRYSAPRSYVDFSVQYRARLSGDDRGKGAFLRATLVY